MTAVPSVLPCRPAAAATSSSTTPLLLRRRWPRYHLHLVRSKAVILLLMWNLCVSAGPGFLKTLMLQIGLALRHMQHEFVFSTSTSLVYVTMCLLYPISGLLGDIYCGRYRVIYSSMTFMVLATAGLALFCGLTWRLNNQATLQWYAITAIIVLYITSTVGLAGFKANAVQFGADQIHEEPSGKWTTMVRWFAWTTALGREFSESALLFILSFRAEYELMLYFIFFIVILAPFTLLLVATCACNKIFTTANIFPHPSYKEILGVLNFARKHKYPIRQSHWSDSEPLSRINYASERFGGPFSSETVEDVKMLLNMLLLLVIMSSFHFTTVACDYLIPLFAEHLSVNKTYYDSSLIAGGKLTLFGATIALALLYELVLHPLFSSYVSNTFKCFGVGLAILIINTFIPFVIDTVGHSHHRQVHCMLFLSTEDLNASILEDTQLDINPLVLVTVNFLNIVSSVIINTSVLTFILAQSPQSMKGLMIGLFSFFETIYVMAGVLLFQVFYGLFKTTQHSYPSCGFGYYLSNTVLTIAAFALFCHVARKYKYRERTREY